MKHEKLIRSIGNIANHYIEEAASQQEVPSKRNILRYLSAACAMVFLIVTTAFATNYAQKSIRSYYMRYLSPQEMAIADSVAAEFGAKVYFDALKTDDAYKQYFAINKLVEYFNDGKVREQAIVAITPFLTCDEEKIADAAAFSLTILKREFDDPRILLMADGSMLFTLFHDYSDYGTYNQIWRIKDNQLYELMSFDHPQMYIGKMIPSPDQKLLAVTLSSNKSSYLLVFDVENHTISPELVDSARILIASDLGDTFWQRMDYENYSGISNIVWVREDQIEFHASLSYDGGEVVEEAVIRFDFHQKEMEYVLTGR